MVNKLVAGVALLGALHSNPQDAKAEVLNPKVVRVTEQVSRLSTNVATHGALLALNDKVGEGHHNASSSKEIDEKLANIVEDFFIDLEYNYGIKLDPNKEISVERMLRNVLSLGAKISFLDKSLELANVPKEKRDIIIANFQKKREKFQQYLDQEDEGIMIAYRDITEEGRKIDERLQKNIAEEKKIKEEIAILKAKLAANEAKVAENEAKVAANEAKAAELENLHKVLQETQEMLQGFILQQEQLKKEKQGLQREKQELQKQQGPMTT